MALIATYLRQWYCHIYSSSRLATNVSELLSHRTLESHRSLLYQWLWLSHLLSTQHLEVSYLLYCKTHQWTLIRINYVVRHVTHPGRIIHRLCGHSVGGPAKRAVLRPCILHLVIHLLEMSNRCKALQILDPYFSMHFLLLLVIILSDSQRFFHLHYLLQLYFIFWLLITAAPGLFPASILHTPKHLESCPH